MGTVTCSRGEKVLVDDEDLDLVSSTSWCISGGGYVQGKRGGKVIKMHRLIMDAKDGDSTDHINGDRLDNRKSNLRLCSHTQNMHNRKKLHNNTSGYIGVTYDKSMQRKKRWGASVNHDGKRIKIGRFFTPEEAARAYDKVVLKLRGEFARTNFRRIQS